MKALKDSIGIFSIISRRNTVTYYVSIISLSIVIPSNYFKTKSLYQLDPSS